MLKSFLLYISENNFSFFDMFVIFVGVYLLESTNYIELVIFLATSAVVSVFIKMLYRD